MAREPKDAPTLDDLNEQIATLKAELTALAGQARERGEDLVDETVSRGRRAYSRLRREAGDHFAEARSHGQEYLERGETAIRQNPATAMGVAVGVGFLVGLLLARR